MSGHAHFFLLFNISLHPVIAEVDHKSLTVTEQSNGVRRVVCRYRSYSKYFPWSCSKRCLFFPQTKGAQVCYDSLHSQQLSLLIDANKKKNTAYILLRTTYTTDCTCFLRDTLSNSRHHTCLDTNGHDSTKVKNYLSQITAWRAQTDTQTVLCTPRGLFCCTLAQIRQCCVLICCTFLFLPLCWGCLRHSHQ